MSKITVTIDISASQNGFKFDDLVYVNDDDDANYGHYGSIADTSSYTFNLRLRDDWKEKLAENGRHGNKKYVVVNFGGGGGDKWSKLYHVSQLINVHRLGMLVIDAMTKKENKS